MQAKAGENYQDEWSRDFEIKVTVADVGIDASGIDADTLSLEADSDILTLSDDPIRRPAQNEFVFSASIEALEVGDDDEDEDTDVTITASVSDMAGNMSNAMADTSTAMVTLAARTAPTDTGHCVMTHLQRRLR